MTHRVVLGITCMIALTGSPPIFVAPADVAGAWKVTMDGDVQRKPDGSTVAKGQIEGLLVLTQKGADITGTWTAIDEWKLTGRIGDDGRMELTSGRQAIPFSKGRDKGSVQARWVFRGTFKDGSLRGTAFLEIGDAEPPPRRWSAVRK